jgi:nucleoside-diphosphate-sugar epimerase
MRELVLGGEGLIGSSLVKTLEKQGHTVRSLDLRSGFDLRKPFDPAPFSEADRVWFLAWDTGGSKYIEAENAQHIQYKNNCEISLRVFDALERTKTPFLFTTSQLAVLPTAYGTTKKMAWHWASHLGGKVARLWNVYGWEHPDVKSHVVTDLVLSGLQGRVSAMTKGFERRRFLYKTDCVEAIISLFESDIMTAEIAGDRWISIREIAEEVGRQLNVEVEYGNREGSEVPVDPVEVLPAWQPRVDLKEGINSVIHDAREYLGHTLNAEVVSRS